MTNFFYKLKINKNDHEKQVMHRAFERMKQEYLGNTQPNYLNLNYQKKTKLT